MKTLYATLLLLMSSNLLGLLYAGDILGNLDELQETIKFNCQLDRTLTDGSVQGKALEALQAVIAHVTASTEEAFTPTNDFWNDVVAFAQSMDALTESLNINKPAFYEGLANTARNHSPQEYSREALAESLLVFAQGTAISAPSSRDLDNLTHSVDLTIAAGLFLSGLDNDDSNVAASSTETANATSGEYGLVYTAAEIDAFNRQFYQSILRGSIR